MSIIALMDKGKEGTGVAVLVFLLVAGAVSAIVNLNKSPPELTVAEAEQAHAAVAEATDLRSAFFAKQSAFTVDEAVATRDKLLALRDRFERGSAAYEEIGLVTEEMVEGAIRSRMKAVSAAPGITGRQEALVAYGVLHRSFLGLPPPRPVSETATVSDDGGGVASTCFALYECAMLATAAVFLLRLRRRGWRIREEVFLHFEEFADFVIFWPIGLLIYPKETAWDFRRGLLSHEFCRRKGRDYKLTDADVMVIEEMARGSFSQACAELDAICDAPARVWSLAMLWARTTAYVSALASTIFTPFSLVRAQTAGGAGGAIVDAHGFVKVDGGPEESVRMGSSLIIVNGHPVRDVRVDLIAEPSKSRVRDMMVEVRPAGGAITVSAGQGVSRMGQFVPRPDRFPLIGGPGRVEEAMTFLDVGVTAAGDHGLVRWSASALSGSGPNKPDMNTNMDLLGTFTVRPWEPYTGLENSDSAFMNKIRYCG